MKKHSKTKQHGGVTPLPLRYFNPDATAKSVNNASGAQSAYGTIEGVSFPNTNLAPFPGSTLQMTGGIRDNYDLRDKINTASESISNFASTVKDHTGGATKKAKKGKNTKRSKSPKRKSPAKKSTVKKSPRKVKRSKSLMKRVVNTVKHTVKRTASKVKSTASKVKKALTPKRKKTQRGGASMLNCPNMDCGQPFHPTWSKQTGGGSDWRMVQYSRGPSNSPGMSDTQFRQFNHTSKNIPGMQLYKFATPLLNNSDATVSGPAPVHSGGAKKTKKHTKKASKAPAKKKTTTKKAKRKSPAKKRTVNKKSTHKSRK